MALDFLTASCFCVGDDTQQNALLYADLDETEAGLAAGVAAVGPHLYKHLEYVDTTFIPNEALGVQVSSQTGVVELVDPDSQADRAGVRARWTIAKVDGHEYSVREQRQELKKLVTGTNKFVITWRLPYQEVIAAYDEETTRLKMQLQEMKQLCEGLRTHSHEQGLQLQHAILQKEEAAVALGRHEAKVNELKSESSAAQDDASLWRKHAQNQESSASRLREQMQEQGFQLQQATLQKEEEAAARCRHEAKVKELISKFAAAHDDASHWRKHAQSQESSASRLREQVQELNKQVRRKPGGGGALNFEQLADQVAENECKALENMNPEARQAFKKKLLVKWHPDKQPSAENAALATCVMQALQNRPEWNT